MHLLPSGLYWICKTASRQICQAYLQKAARYHRSLLTVGFGISPNQCLSRHSRAVPFPEFTAGGEFHPAPKTAYSNCRSISESVLSLHASVSSFKVQDHQTSSDPTVFFKQDAMDRSPSKSFFGLFPDRPPTIRACPNCPTSPTQIISQPVPGPASHNSGLPELSYLPHSNHIPACSRTGLPQFGLTRIALPPSLKSYPSLLPDRPPTIRAYPNCPTSPHSNHIPISFRRALPRPRLFFSSRPLSVNWTILPFGCPVSQAQKQAYRKTHLE